MRPRVVHLIEDAGSGTVLLQDLNGRVPVIRFCPRGAKLMRFQGVTHWIEAGEVHLPAGAPWLDVFKREVLSFPRSSNNDQVDALSQLLLWAHSRRHGPVQGRYTLT
jgi:predicted phage terminase large subunit-like protein